MAEITWYQILTSAGVVSALIATGAFVQKSRDNTAEISSLKDRVKKLEDERVNVATLVAKVGNLEDQIIEIKRDIKEDLNEIKTLIRGQQFFAHKSGK